jgi:sulfur carrier protein ThiS
MKTAMLVVVPGPGARQIQIENNMTVADLITRENLYGRDVIINGVGVQPSQFSTQTLSDAIEIFATGSVKGNQI